MKNGVLGGCDRPAASGESVVGLTGDPGTGELAGTWNGSKYEGNVVGDSGGDGKGDVLDELLVLPLQSLMKWI